MITSRQMDLIKVVNDAQSRSISLKKPFVWASYRLRKLPRISHRIDITRMAHSRAQRVRIGSHLESLKWSMSLKELSKPSMKLVKRQRLQLISIELERCSVEEPLVMWTLECTKWPESLLPSSRLTKSTWLTTNRDRRLCTRWAFYLDWDTLQWSSSTKHSKLRDTSCWWWSCVQEVIS